jgi:hypothetical protein
VLLFYPDGKRSSSSEGHLANGPGGDHAAVPPGAIPAPHAHPQAAAAAAAAGGPAAAHAPHMPHAAHAPHMPHAAPHAPLPGGGAAQQQAAQQQQQQQQQQQALVPAGQQGVAHLADDAPGNIAFAQAQAQAQAQQLQLARMPRRDTTVGPRGAGNAPACPPPARLPGARPLPRLAAVAHRTPATPATQNEYAALFVALIGEGPNPQGVVNTSEGKVVRAFHRFTLVDQLGQGRDLTKGRTREAGAVKISCARQVRRRRRCCLAAARRRRLALPARAVPALPAALAHLGTAAARRPPGTARPPAGPQRAQLPRLPQVRQALDPGGARAWLPAQRHARHPLHHRARSLLGRRAQPQRHRPLAHGRVEQRAEHRAARLKDDAVHLDLRGEGRGAGAGG